MEALNFLKFWRSTTTTTHKENQSFNENSDTTEIPSYRVEMDNEFDEGDDSFIDLELTLPDFDNKRDNRNNNSNSNFDSKDNQLHNSAENAGDIILKSSSQPTLSLSSNDVLSKRRIMPIEPISSRPQSPISLLKSAPSFRVSIFKKSKSTATQKTEKTELNSTVSMDTPKHEKKEESKLYTVKFKIEEASNISIFTRENSLRRKHSLEDTSKRFSKELIQKYLKLIKPLYIKVSKRNSHSEKMMGFSGELLTASSVASSPATVPIFSPKKEKEKHPNIPAGIRVACKHLGKSRSASAASPVSKCDDSLLLQHDGIQSAILHCKRSFNSSRDSSLLSRSTSTYSSARDSSGSSGSDFLSEKSIGSARNSNEERNGFTI